MKTAQVKACEAFYQGRSIEQIKLAYGYNDITTVSSTLSSFGRKLRKYVAASELPEREAVFAYADRKYMDRNAAWYCFFAAGQGIRQLMHESSRMVPEIVRLSLKFDHERNRQLSASDISRRLRVMGFENATDNSVDVIRSRLRGFGHPIKLVHKNKAPKSRSYDPMAGTVARMSERLNRPAFYETRATMLFWTRGLQRDVFIVKKVAAEMTRELLTLYGPDYTMTGREFLEEIGRIASSQLRIDVQTSTKVAA